VGRGDLTWYPVREKYSKSVPPPELRERAEGRSRLNRSRDHGGVKRSRESEYRCAASKIREPTEDGRRKANNIVTNMSIYEVGQPWKKASWSKADGKIAPVRQKQKTCAVPGVSLSRKSHLNGEEGRPELYPIWRTTHFSTRDRPRFCARMEIIAQRGTVLTLGFYLRSTQSGQP